MVLLVCLLKPKNANEGGRNSGSFRFGISVSVENLLGFMSGGSVPIGMDRQLEWAHGGRRKTVMANSRESPKGPWWKGLTSVDKQAGDTEPHRLWLSVTPIDSTSSWIHSNRSRSPRTFELRQALAQQSKRV